MQILVVHVLRLAEAYGPRLVLALVLFLVAWLTGSIVSRVVAHVGRSVDKGKADVLRLAGQTAKAVILVVGGVCALGTLGINVSAIVASLGLGGFALGFALRDALSNVLAGALILMYQPFRRGQRILVAGCEGEVLEINLRYTVLRGTDRTFLIPNATMYTTTVTLLAGGDGGDRG